MNLNLSLVGVEPFKYQPILELNNWPNGFELQEIEDVNDQKLERDEKIAGLFRECLGKPVSEFQDYMRRVSEKPYDQIDRARFKTTIAELVVEMDIRRLADNQIELELWCDSHLQDFFEKCFHKLDIRFSIKYYGTNRLIIIQNHRDIITLISSLIKEGKVKPFVLDMIKSASFKTFMESIDRADSMVYFETEAIKSEKQKKISKQIKIQLNTLQLVDSNNLERRLSKVNKKWWEKRLASLMSEYGELLTEKELIDFQEKQKPEISQIILDSVSWSYWGEGEFVVDAIIDKNDQILKRERLLRNIGTNSSLNCINYIHRLRSEPFPFIESIKFTNKKLGSFVLKKIKEGEFELEIEPHLSQFKWLEYDLEQLIIDSSKGNCSRIVKGYIQIERFLKHMVQRGQLHADYLNLLKGKSFKSYKENEKEIMKSSSEYESKVQDSKMDEDKYDQKSISKKLEMHWAVLAFQKGAPLTDVEKAWNIPSSFFPKFMQSPELDKVNSIGRRVTLAEGDVTRKVETKDNLSDWIDEGIYQRKGIKIQDKKYIRII